MSDTKEKDEVSTKVNSFVENNKKVFLIVGIVLVALLVIYIVGFAISNNAKEKNLATIDSITYALVDNSMSADEAELTTRRNKALEDLQPLVGKSGIVGARANMLAAEISYQLENKADAAAYWTATASKAKKTYIEPIAYFNLAVVNEDLGNMDEAIANYKLAADDVDFILNTHAKFNYARCLETKGDYEGAVAAYKELFDTNPNDSWAQLGKTRILALETEGKVE